MRRTPLTVSILIFLPIIFYLVAVDALGIRGLFSYLGSWAPVWLALLATALLLVLERFRT